MMSLQHFRLTTILLALVCFVMPWFQFRCDGPDGSEWMVEQSGLQAAYGGVSKYANGRLVEGGAKIPEEPDHEPAWLLTVFASALVLALLASQWMRRGNPRWLAVTLLSAVAAGALIAQIVNGFPIFDHIPMGIPKEEIEYTPWYWIAIATTIVTPIASLLEWPQLRSVNPRLDEPTVERPAWGE
jgi:hypothetical protein